MVPRLFSSFGIRFPPAMIKLILFFSIFALYAGDENCHPYTGNGYPDYSKVTGIGCRCGDVDFGPNGPTPEYLARCRPNPLVKRPYRYRPEPSNYRDCVRAGRHPRDCKRRHRSHNRRRYRGGRRYNKRHYIRRGYPTTETDECLMKVQSGPCEGLFERYFYDTGSQICRKFNFGGCAGNGNNFESFQGCMDSCFTKHILDSEGLCRNGEPPVAAFVAPCDVTTCNVDGSICYDDYCGGPNARFFNLVGRELTSNECSDDFDPCISATCPGCYACQNQNGLAVCVAIENCDPCAGSPCGECEYCVHARKYCIRHPCGDQYECRPKRYCNPPNPTCQENEIFQNCGTNCPTTCASQYLRRPCIYSCKRGCFCKRNYVLDEEGGSCIPIAECSNDSALTCAQVRCAYGHCRNTDSGPVCGKEPEEPLGK